MPDARGDLTDAELDRLLAHIAATDTVWFRAAAWLIEFGLRGVPDDRSPRNPAKWLAARVGCAMEEAQHRRVNRRLAEREVSRMGR